MRNKLLFAAIAAALMSAPVYADDQNSNPGSATNTVSTTNTASTTNNDSKGKSDSKMHSGSKLNADFNAIDRNKDGQVARDEYDSFVGKSNLYSKYDKDRDNYLTDTEFDGSDFDGDIDIYSDWDRDMDSRLDDDEFYDGMYSHYDRNQDGFLDNGEWDDVGDDGLWDY